MKNIKQIWHKEAEIITRSQEEEQKKNTVRQFKNTMQPIKK